MEEHHIAIAHLVEDADQMAFTKGSTLSGLHRRDIRDIAVVANGIVVDEVANLLDETVVAHSDIAQGGIIDTRVFHKAFGHFHLLLEDTQSDVAIEDDTMEVVGRKLLSDLYALPVFSPTAIILEDLYLLAG